MTHLWRDACYAARSSFRRGSRLSTTALVLILAVGIGSATAMFSIADGVLLRPLPFPAQKELVRIHLLKFDSVRKTTVSQVANLRLLEAWQRQGLIGTTLAGFQGGTASLAGAWGTRSVQVVGVTPNMMDLLGVRAAAGRSFSPEDSEPGTVPSIVLSRPLCLQLFGLDASAVGAFATLNGRRFQIVGVMPANFHVPLSIPSSQQSDPELWIPIHSLAELMDLPAGMSLPVEVLARLRDVSRPSVTVELNRLAEDGGAGGLRQARIATKIDTLSDVRKEFVGRPIAILSGAVFSLLLLTCLNASNLMMARTVGRDREFAIRIALGASRRRLLRQFLPESVGLSLSGGLLGTALALLVTSTLAALGNTYLPGAGTITLNDRVLVFALTLGLLSGVGVGTWPVITILNKVPMEAINLHSASLRRSGRRFMRVLVSTEVALSIIVLMAMGLMGRSFLNLTNLKRGYDTKDTVVAGLFLRGPHYASDNDRQVFSRRILLSLKSSGGLAFPAISTGLPVVGGNVGSAWAAESDRTGTKVRAAIWSVTKDYFRSLGIPVVRGSQAEPDAGSQDVVIDTAAARLLFGSADPLGRRLEWNDGDHAAGVVSGVTGNIQELLVDVTTRAKYRDVQPHIYVVTQDIDSVVVRVSARASVDLASAVRVLQNAISGVDPASARARIDPPVLARNDPGSL